MYKYKYKFSKYKYKFDKYKYKFNKYKYQFNINYNNMPHNLFDIIRLFIKI